MLSLWISMVSRALRTPYSGMLPLLSACSTTDSGASKVGTRNVPWARISSMASSSR